MVSKTIDGIIFMLVACLLTFGLVILTYGCKFQNGSTTGDTRGDETSADDGSTVTANEVAVGGDITNNGDGAVGVDLSNRPVTSTGDNSNDNGSVDGVDTRCEDIRFPDGADFGNLIKPEDEDGKLAILFDEEFVQTDENGDPVPFVRVSVFLSEEVVDAETGTVRSGQEDLKFIGFANELEGQYRQKWEAKLPGKFYTGQIVIQIGNGRVCELNIDGGLGERVD